jgi:hypothetical protein
MIFDGDELLGRSPNEVLDRIRQLECKEEQARALMRVSYLLKVERGASLARELAANDSPCCKYVANLLELQREEDAWKRSAAAAKKAKALANAAKKPAPPSLFDPF